MRIELNRRRIGGFSRGILRLVVLLWVCSQPAIAQQAAAPSGQNPLADILTPDALAYLRLPLLSNFTTRQSPYFRNVDNDTADAALRGLRTALGESLQANLPPQAAMMTGDLLALFVESMAAPLELAVMPPSDPAVPLPSLLLSTAFDLSPEALAARLNNMSAANPLMMFTGGLDAEGYGTLSLANMPMVFSYRNGRFTGLITPASSRTLLTSLMSGATNPGNPLTAFESRVDQGGRGAVAWFNMASIMTMAAVMLPPEQVAQMENAGLTSLAELGIGMGYNGDMGKVLIAGTFIEPPPYIPVIDNRFAFTTRGRPGFFGALALPDSATVEQWIDAIGSRAEEPGAPNRIRTLEAQLGVRLRQFTDALGSEIAFFRDEAGTFGAVRVRDAEALDSLLLDLQVHEAIVYSSREVDDTRYHHLAFAPVFAESETPDAGSNPMVNQLMTRLFLGNTHVFWVQEGDYLILAQVPQALMARANHSGNLSAANWLRDNIGQDTTNNLLSFAGEIEQLPTQSYYLYLNTLMSMADIGQTPFDIYDFPPAHELDLPDSGSLGLQLDLSRQRIELGMNFVNTPLDFALQGNSMTQVAVIGILAAVAIPAYQDYTLRAEVGSALGETMGMRALVENYYRDNGMFPDSATAAAINAQFADSDNAYTLAPDSGVIVIEFLDEADLLGNSITSRPMVLNNGITWTCEPDANFDYSYLPSRCVPE